MKPFDPRLLSGSRAAHRSIAVVVTAGCGVAVAVMAQAWLLSRVVTGAFLDGEGWAALRVPMLALLGVVVARAVLTWAAEAGGHRGAARVVSDLRSRLCTHLVALGPVHLGEERTGELATTATTGLDALDLYFARYLPQLALAAIVPVVVIAWVATLDLVSAVTLAVTVPLIPVFMALIGVAAEDRTRARWRALSLLSAHFLDVLRGLPTLRVFGRGAAQTERIREVTDAYRRTTMGTLRVAFLSALVLETLATVGTALIAVGIGVRLVDGGIGLQAGLCVLVLAPEVYLPLRQVGAQFHASMNGMAAAERVFTLLETPAPAHAGVAPVPDLRRATVRFESVSYTYPSRVEPALRGLDLELRPGRTLALVGDSGAGKSTVVSLLLRFAEPSSGRITVGGVDLRDIDVVAWRRALGWVPQRPHLLRASIADNVRLGRPEAGDTDVREALRRAGAASFVAALPDGLATRVEEEGATLSAGQRRRIAVARALLRDAPVLVLDEPAANLDPLSRVDLDAVLRRVARGRTVLVVGHGEAAATWADATARLDGGRAVPVEAAADGPEPRGATVRDWGWEAS